MDSRLISDTVQNVSRETFEKLKAYQSHLIRWNKKINLVGPVTANELWDRHIIDCLQIIHHLPHKSCSVADFGSGAGLPGMVVAIASEHHVTLIDKNQKKTTFLKYVSRETLVPCRVISTDFLKIEQSFDVIVTRAVMDCLQFYRIAAPRLNDNGYILMFSGENSLKNFEELKKNFGVTFEVYPSITNKASSIVKVLKGE